MLKALGPRLQHLSATHQADRSKEFPPDPGNSLQLGMLKHCTLLRRLSLDDLLPGQPALVYQHLPGRYTPNYYTGTLLPSDHSDGIESGDRKHHGSRYSCLMLTCVLSWLQEKARASLSRCSELSLSCPAHVEVRVLPHVEHACVCTATRSLCLSAFLVQHALDLRVLLVLEQTSGVQASLLPHVIGLRRLNLHVGYIDDKGFKIAEYTLAPIIEGVCTCDTQLGIY